MTILRGDETNGLDTDSAEVAGKADLVLHGFVLVDGSTVGAVKGRFTSINGSKVLAVDFERLRVIVVKRVLITSHLFTLLQYLRGLGSKVGVAIRVHIGQLQQTAGDSSSEDKVLHRKTRWA